MGKYLYTAVLSKNYRKQLKTVSKDTTGKYDINELNDVLDKLCRGENLPYDDYKDHKLGGKYGKNKERACHIGGFTSDFLLRYKKDNKRMLIHLLAVGDHEMVYGNESAILTEYYFLDD